MSIDVPHAGVFEPVSTAASEDEESSAEDDGEREAGAQGYEGGESTEDTAYETTSQEEAEAEDEETEE